MASIGSSISDGYSLVPPAGGSTQGAQEVEVSPAGCRFLTLAGGGGGLLIFDGGELQFTATCQMRVPHRSNAFSVDFQL
jgi:hypothetical protein